MTQEPAPYAVTAHTNDPAAANLILAAVIDEARRTGAQVNIGGRVPAPNGSVVNVKAAQGDQLADAANMFITWAEAAEKPDYRSRTWCLSSVFRLGLRAKVAVI